MILTILQRTLQFLANRVEAERLRLRRKEHLLNVKRSREQADFAKRHAALLAEHRAIIAGLDAEVDACIIEQNVATKLKERISL